MLPQNHHSPAFSPTSLLRNFPPYEPDIPCIPYLDEMLTLGTCSAECNYQELVTVTERGSTEDEINWFYAIQFENLHQTTARELIEDPLSNRESPKSI